MRDETTHDRCAARSIHRRHVRRQVVVDLDDDARPGERRLADDGRPGRLVVGAGGDEELLAGGVRRCRPSAPADEVGPGDHDEVGRAAPARRRRSAGRRAGPGRGRDRRAAPRPRRRARRCAGRTRRGRRRARRARRGAAGRRGPRASVADSSSIRASASSVSAGSRWPWAWAMSRRSRRSASQATATASTSAATRVERGVVGDGGERRRLAELVVEPSASCGQVVRRARRARPRRAGRRLLAAGEAHDRGAGQLEPRRAAAIGADRRRRRDGASWRCRGAGSAVVAPPLSHWRASRTGGRRRRRGRGR